MIFPCYFKNKESHITTNLIDKKIRTSKKQMIRSQTNMILYNLIENDEEYFNQCMFNKLILSPSKNKYKYNNSHNSSKFIIKVTKIHLQKPSIDILNLNYISSPEQKN